MTGRLHYEGVRRDAVVMSEANRLDSLVGLSGFRCIVADPPWPYGKFNNGANARKSFSGGGALPLPYKAMTVQEIAALPVGVVADENAHLYLWTTSRYLPDSFAVMKAWGFRYSQTLVWAKTPGGLGLGGAFAPTTEFVLFGRRGKLPASRRVNSTWWNWKRQNCHSRKPEAFQDMVETVSPGPYLELFARRPRMNWTVWGNEVEANAKHEGQDEV